MASSSETEESSSINNNDDDDDNENENESIFYDANSSWSDKDQPESSLHSSHTTFNQKPSQKSFFTIQLTESQVHDLKRRDQLQLLRAQEDQTKHNQINTGVHEPVAIFPYRPVLTNDSIQSHEQPTQSRDQEEKPEAPDLLKDHIRADHSRRSKKIIDSSPCPMPILFNTSSTLPIFQHQRSLPYPTLPSASISRGPVSLFSKITNLSAISEPNIVDMSLIEHDNKFDGILFNRRKMAEDDPFTSFAMHSFDHEQYTRPSDANPMTQTILERAQGSTTMMMTRQSSVLNSNHSHIRRNSADQHSLGAEDNLEMNQSRKKHLSRGSKGDNEDDDDDDDDNESTSSESSSTRSSHNVTVSSPSTVVKSSKAAIRTASLLFHGGKQKLTRLMNRSFLRNSRKKSSIGQNQTADVDEEEDDGEKLLLNDGFNGDLKYKASRFLKDSCQFDKTQLLQTIVNAHNGPIWCMKFSLDGHLLATGGQDKMLKVWLLKSTAPYFNDLSPITSNLSKEQNEILAARFHAFHQTMSNETYPSTINTKLGLHELHAPFYSRPFCELVGHQAPVLDVAWSKSLFLLSSSMDKTVRLWHLSRLECLCSFRHVDFVSAISFHPRDDRYFVSASLDGHVRLWNIPDKRVICWTLIPAQRSSLITAAQANLITSVHFCDEGRKVTVGTFDGRFLLYTDSLEYETVMNIGDKDGSRSHRSRKKCRKPYKITGIESMNSSHSRVLITSNDSRIRLYDTRSREIERKYRGYSNQCSQIRASFSHDDLYIISGSEDGWFYVWRTEPNNTNHSDNSTTSNTAVTRKQQRQFGRAFERIRVHNTMVTSAIFAPNPNSIMDFLYSSMTLTTVDHPQMTNRSHMTNNSQNVARSLTTTISSITPIINNYNRTRLICMQAPPSPTESPTSTSSLMSTQGNSYVMVTADSKGQLKLLVNRFHR